MCINEIERLLLSIQVSMDTEKVKLNEFWSLLQAHLETYKNEQT